MSIPPDPEFDGDFTELTKIEAFEHRIAGRCAYFTNTFSEYNKKLHREGVGGAFIHSTLLLNAIESYFDDIGRLKKYHRMLLADRFKIAAYTVKWLCRIRPIQVPDVPTRKPAAYVLLPNVNELFALLQGLHISGVHYDDVDRQILAQLAYAVHYRDCDPGVLATLFQTIHRAWPSTTLAPKPAHV